MEIRMEISFQRATVDSNNEIRIKDMQHEIWTWKIRHNPCPRSPQLRIGIQDLPIQSWLLSARQSSILTIRNALEVGELEMSHNFVHRKSPTLRFRRHRSPTKTLDLRSTRQTLG